MKRKLLILFICVIVVLNTTGCNNDKQSINVPVDLDKNIPVEANEQSKKTFKIDEFPKIYQVSNKFIALLEKNTVHYDNIVYEIGNYTNGEYKNVVINLNDQEYLTMKFSDEGILLVSNLYGGVSKTVSKDYENTKLTMLQFDYYGFTSNEILTILKSEEYEINDYKIMNTHYPSFNMFVIIDSVN